MIKVSIEEIIARSFIKALPKIEKVINKNKAKDKYLKRVKNRKGLKFKGN